MFELTTAAPSKAPKVGDMRVSYIHQAGAVMPICCPATNIIDAYNKVQLIASLMLSLYSQHAIPDYSNAIFIEVYEQDHDQPEEGEWVSWECTEEGAWYDEPEALVEQFTENGWFLASDKPFYPEADKPYLVIDHIGLISVLTNSGGEFVLDSDKINSEKIVAYKELVLPTTELPELEPIIFF